MNRTFQQTYHIPGTLTANIAIKFTAHANMSLVHVSAVASNDSDATLAIGKGHDADGYLAAATIGDSGTPKEFDLDDFDGALLTDAGKEYPRIEAGDVVQVDLDFDGASGTVARM